MWGVLAVGVPLAGCDSGGTECACSAAGLTVNLPTALAGDVATISLSGAACSDAGIDPPPGTRTTVFRVSPNQPGPCQIDIAFTSGTTFSDSLTVVETTGCCAGLRTSPLEAAEIDVPAPDDGGD